MPLKNGITIAVSKEVYARLVRYGAYRDSMSEIVSRVLDIAEEKEKVN